MFREEEIYGVLRILTAKYGLTRRSRLSLWSSSLPPLPPPYSLTIDGYREVVQVYGRGKGKEEEEEVRGEIERDVGRSVFGTTKPPPSNVPPHTSSVINTTITALSLRSLTLNDTKSRDELTNPNPNPNDLHTPPSYPPRTGRLSPLDDGRISPLYRVAAVGRQTAVGVREVERVLEAAAWVWKDVGYVQGMDYVASHCWFMHKEEQEEGGGEGIEVERGESGELDDLVDLGERKGGLTRGQRIRRWSSRKKNIKGKLPKEGEPIFRDRFFTEDSEEAFEHDRTTNPILDTEYKTYTLFASLLHHRSLYRMYEPGLQFLLGMVERFDVLIGRHLQVLKEHLEREELTVQSFSLGWFQTLFLTVPNIPFSTVSRIWDIFITTSSYTIFHQCGLAILAGSQALLLNMDFEEMMDFFMNMPGGEGNLLEPRKLMMLAATFKIKH